MEEYGKEELYCIPPEFQPTMAALEKTCQGSRSSRTLLLHIDNHYLDHHDALRIVEDISTHDPMGSLAKMLRYPSAAIQKCPLGCGKGQCRGIRNCMETLQDRSRVPGQTNTLICQVDEYVCHVYLQASCRSHRLIVLVCLGQSHDNKGCR